MLFIEKGKIIKAEDSKDTGFIMAFNVAHNNRRSFFLKVDDLDNFSEYMNSNHPEIVVEFEYPALID